MLLYKQPCQETVSSIVEKLDQYGHSYRSNSANLCRIFNEDPFFAEENFQYNIRSGDVIFKKEEVNTYDLERFCNDLTLAFSNTYKMVSLTRTQIEDQVLINAKSNRYDPVKNYLTTLPEWDKKPRVDTFFKRYLDADDTDLVNAMTRCFFLSAVARAMEPGCVAQTMLVLKGEEGNGKSNIFKTLASGLNKEEDSYYSEQKINLANQNDSLINCMPHWIIEWGELSEIGKFSNEDIKRFISAAKDDIRFPYGKKSFRIERAFIIVGSTNQGHFLKSLTGTRRFHIVPVNRPSHSRYSMEKLIAERDQLWAEALYRYNNGEKWSLSEEEEKEHDEFNEQFRSIHPFEVHITDYLSSLGDEEKSLLKHSIVLEQAYGTTTHRAKSSSDSIIIEDIMCKLGYKRKRINNSFCWVISEPKKKIEKPSLAAQDVKEPIVSLEIKELTKQISLMEKKTLSWDENQELNQLKVKLQNLIKGETY